MAADRPATLTEIGLAAEAFLREQGALDEAELLAQLAGAGVDLGIDPADTLDEVLHDEGLAWVACLADSRHAHLPSLMEGRTFTHRPTSFELEHDVVFVDPDLLPLSMLADDETHELPAAGGGSVREVMAGFDPDDDLLAERGIPAEAVGDGLAWLLPAGTLRGSDAAPDELVGFRWVDGTVLVERGLTAGEAAPDVGRRLVEVVEGADDERPLPLDVVVATVLADDDEGAAFLAPLAPLGELVEQLGLAREGEMVGPSGFDFGGWREKRRVATIARNHRLDEDGALSVLALLGVHRALTEEIDDLTAEGGEGGSAGDTAAAATPGTAAATAAAAEPWGDWATLEPVLLEHLADERVAEAFFHEAVGIGVRGAPALGALAETFAGRAPTVAQPALAWLRARALDRIGDVDGAEAELERAHGLDPDFAPASRDLAWFASDRGDLERSLSLLRRSGAEPDDPFLALLERLRRSAPSSLGRNDRCWCGSGRKYKQCHLGREVPPLEERGGWLIHKAVTYAESGPWRRLVLDVAQVRARWQESDLALLDALEDPFVMDVVLFEGGAFEDFLEVRGHLLPDDERLLADQWLLVERSLFEVEAVEPGASVSVRDVRTGDRLVARERTASRSLRRGDLLCARVVPVGDTAQFMGGVEPVAMHQRDELMDLLDAEPDPLELVELLSRRFAPPVLHNTEGHDLVMCEVELAVGDGLAEALTGRFGEPDGDPPTWHEHVTTHGMDRLRATYELDGDRLRIDTNSVERADDAIALVRSLDAGAEVVADRRTPAADLREAMGRAGDLPDDGPAGPTDLLEDPPPELRAELDRLVRGWEEQWLDESIPALEGLTPRQAAADPTRREDLVRLLDSFGAPAEFTMDPDRLRNLLGLDR